MERLSAKLCSAGLVPLCFSWAAHDGSPDQNRIVEAMMRASAARFEKIESYTRLQHYSASDVRFGLKGELLARIHYDRSTGKSFEVLSRGGSPLLQSRVFD